MAPLQDLIFELQFRNCRELRRENDVVWNFKPLGFARVSSNPIVDANMESLLS